MTPSDIALLREAARGFEIEALVSRRSADMYERQGAPGLALTRRRESREESDKAARLRALADEMERSLTKEQS